MLIPTSSDDNDSKDGFTDERMMRNASNDNYCENDEGAEEEEEENEDDEGNEGEEEEEGDRTCESSKSAESDTDGRTVSKRRYYSEFKDDDDDDDDDDNGEHSKKAKYERTDFSTATFSKEEENYHSATTAQQASAKTKEESSFNSKGIAHRMMQKMGYEEGKGLGKRKQGRLVPVEAAKQHGRRGLGHYIPGLSDASLKWDPTQEVVSVQEEIIWLQNKHKHVPTLEEMNEWLALGPRKETIHDENMFCSSEIVTQVINSKTIFDKLDKVEMRRARTRSNPFETIRGAFFLNRAAVKMANMDRACDFMFTKPSGLNDNELLYFADVCAGPGGFSEYVLWRRKWHAKGFGFTLVGENDFKLDDFYAAPCETFHPLYGVKGNGDVFDPENQQDFKKHVMKHTRNVGVHFMMSDGGFSVEGQENLQEILSKQLYLCQCLVALMIVRNGGHFVTKLFDLFTPFSAGLVYLMYRCFDEVCIFKPNTSRPANSERYLICKGKRDHTAAVMKYLDHVNHQLIKLKGSGNDIQELVSLDELELEKEFVEYLQTSNNSLGRAQINGLLKIAAFCEQTNLIEKRQAEMRKECLEYWEIPDQTRTAPHSRKPQERIQQWMSDPKKLFTKEPEELTPDNVKRLIIENLYDWFYVSCASSVRMGEDNKLATFYMGMGRSKVYRFLKRDWCQVSDIKVELPPDTLVYAEVVYEHKREKSRSQKTHALHILDAYVLGGEDISKKYILERNMLIKKFCEALWKPQYTEYARVRAKELHAAHIDIDRKLHVVQRILKNNCPALTQTIPKTFLDDDDGDDQDALYILPRSVLFLKSTAQPWSRHYSRKNKCTYVFHPKRQGSAKFDTERPSAAEAHFDETFENRIIWHWPQDQSLSLNTVAYLVNEKRYESGQ